ncbi:hypothetical protein C0J52_04530 [Blattella germanica]|nr:hypothetical protein C0J52_04530 [Blattella germanica]
MWGICPNGTEGLGCGRPETFRNCADITIVTSTAGLPPIFIGQIDNPFLLFYRDFRSPSLVSPLIIRLMLEEEGRPLREISSVMMTTSGFLSPAREGKLPESRTPLQPSDSRSNSPQPTSYPMVPPEVKGDKKTKKLPFKKTADGIKKIGDKENKKKDHKVKDLAKVDKHMPTDESKVKKLVSMKELKKLKALKSGALKMMAHASTAAGPSTSTKLPKLSPPKITTSKTPNLGTPKMSKPAGQQKTPKMDKCFPLPPMIPQPKALSPEKCKDTGIVEGKLSSEPDKLKLNIFKKISKAKEEKPEKVDRTEHFDPPSRDSRESSPGLIIDESEANSRQREVRMAQIDDCIESVIQRSVEIADEEAKYQRDRKSPTEAEISSSKVDETINDVVSGHASGPGSENDVYMFDDDFSPPGTPSTPRTPELPMPSRKVQEPKEKKRKRDKSKSKKEGKGKSKVSFSPKKMKAELLEPDPYERPKTPEAPDHREPHHPPPPVFPFFPYNPPAPGLIPPPLGHPYFPRFPLPLGKNLPHPAMPNLPLPPPLFMQKKSEEVAEPKEKPAPEKPSSVAAPCPVREEKGEMGVPKITFRLGPPSPRPPTPDAQPRKMYVYLWIQLYKS